MLLSFFILTESYMPAFSQPSQLNLEGSFAITLDISPEAHNNATDYAFHVVVNGVNYSSAAINVPANVTIQITIYNQDNGTDNLVESSDSKVIGTDSGSIAVARYTYGGNMAESVPQPAVFEQVNEVPASVISHTFTTSNGLNIPILPDSVTSANVTFSTPGTYSWGCMCDCGIFPMYTPGWMFGTLLVS